MGVGVEVAEQASDELVAALARLMPQLSRSVDVMDSEAVGALVGWPGSRVLVARVDDLIVGTLTLVVYPAPSGLRARVEDVVVDAAARGRGVGSALMLEAVRLASIDGVYTIDLTSRTSRAAANRLCEELGFELADDRPYRLTLPRRGRRRAAGG
ncbi:GNAT family N-acetyltransferase [Actinoplanes sp. NPDC049265]|uniref:GNAT family N-acetyltransferase n=1 Tax=Actinoplanes sp. NPDC049265 TaxID=3363902 RepID=UPI00371986F7